MPKMELALGKIIRDNEIGREFGEQEEGATTVACVTSQPPPDEEVEEIHRQTRQEDKCAPIYSPLHPPEVEADGQQTLYSETNTCSRRELTVDGLILGRLFCASIRHHLYHLGAHHLGVWVNSEDSQCGVNGCQGMEDKE